MRNVKFDVHEIYQFPFNKLTAKMTQFFIWCVPLVGVICLPYLKVATQCWGLEIDNFSEKHICVTKMKVTEGSKIFVFFENVKSCTCKLLFPFLKLKQLNLKNSRSLNSLVKWKNLENLKQTTNTLSFFIIKFDFEDASSNI